ncbi:unnamed protein product [Notodromas monacha]|uniref:Cytochrome P450 n=1 Tax=Notodromas monacha TaxID=399045 RepID=A0A7R9BDU2_9CRUS|nr:unnamed protein product [Notodromas monacha]CAG0913556.1 unnamed protein product [Notodromas monacha]
MMMRPKEVRHFLPLVAGVVDDFVDRLGSKIDPVTQQVSLLRDEIAKWSLESSAMVCFEKRLGCFDGGSGETWAGKMVEANKQIFLLSGLLKFSLPLYKHFGTPKWKEIVRHEDFFYAEAMRLVRETISKIRDAVDKESLEEGQYSFMTYLLSRGELQEKDVFILTLSLFADGLSTTTPAALYNLYCLAANPEAQEKLKSEIREKVKGEVTSETVENLPYLKACVKEAFRLYPVGTEVSRVIQQDLVLSGFHVPAGTHVDLSPSVHFLSEEHFEDAAKFVPERWLRDKSYSTPKANAHPYLLTPFGFGTRMCAGRRFAEQDLYLLLIKVLQKYDLSYPTDEPELGQKYMTLLFPDRPVRVLFSRKHSETNPNAMWLSGRGMWFTYVFGVFALHIFLLSIPFLSIPWAWTLTNITHDIAMFVFLHTVRGVPWMTLTQGKESSMTHWDQIDYGEQFTASKKFITVIPIVLYILTSYYTNYDSFHCFVNFMALLLVLVPKLQSWQQNPKQL